jgi:hypothetical protein
MRCFDRLVSTWQRYKPAGLAWLRNPDPEGMKVYLLRDRTTFADETMEEAPSRGDRCQAARCECDAQNRQGSVGGVASPEGKLNAWNALRPHNSLGHQTPVWFV